MKCRAAATGTLVTAVCLGATLPALQSTQGGTAAPRLEPTAHLAVPADLDAMWYVPAAGTPAPPGAAPLVRGLRALDDEADARRARPLLEEAVAATGPLADRARVSLGRALNQLQEYERAEAAFTTVFNQAVDGVLWEDAALGLAEARVGRGAAAAAVAVYQQLLDRRPASPHVAWWRLGQAAEQAGDVARAIAAYERVYFDFPLSAEAAQAEQALDRLAAREDEAVDGARELARADALFRARRWADARAAYARARGGLRGPDGQRAGLRVAACDVRLGRARQGRDDLRAFLEGPFADEAGYYSVTALRALDAEAYPREARGFADRHRSSAFAEETLNDLATHLIVADEDDRADAVFRLVIDRYPAGRFAERAYWRSGWWAYRDRRYAEAAGLFDRGAERFPRSDYRPAWLYWSGRAWTEAGRRGLAEARLVVALTDYQNSYYGRLARRHLTPAQAAAATSRFTRPRTGPPQAPPTTDRIATLLAAGLPRLAVGEVQHAQRTFGDTPALTATLAYAHNRAGNLRAGINTMKRAYPQWMAAGGERLPREIQEIVFPLDYWPLLQKHAAARRLDPYLIAALVAQESTFDPVIRSSANAVGLMQVLPSTGGQFARRLKLAGFTPGRLTDPETNVRLGTAIFAQALARFGGVHYALAAYNAGEHRVAAWLRERPDLPQDEFIDDIPFPETQNYVKRILGTADDYRRLYGPR